jgi:hypothetical protein
LNSLFLTPVPLAYGCTKRVEGRIDTLGGCYHMGFHFASNKRISDGKDGRQAKGTHSFISNPTGGLVFLYLLLIP